MIQITLLLLNCLDETCAFHSTNVLLLRPFYVHRLTFNFDKGVVGPFHCSEKAELPEDESSMSIRS